eukprot:jgi/Picsp_1/1856/NSC_05323-R1_ribonuclease h2 subunit b
MQSAGIKQSICIGYKIPGENKDKNRPQPRLDSTNGGTFLISLINGKGEDQEYLVCSDCIQECNSVKKKWSSWFVNDSVISDGSLYLWTPVHVVFIMLPALEKAQKQGMFCSLDHVVDFLQGKNGEQHSLLGVVKSKQEDIKQVCEWKENGGEVYFKLDDGKLLEWLSRRVGIIKNHLESNDETFRALDSQALSAYAIGILSEYLSDEWTDALYAKVGVQKPCIQSDTVAIHGADLDQAETKKPRIDAKVVQKKVKQQEAKAKQMAQDAKGMKKLSSFFSV